jgi:MoaA/NifB/PqqE/SkfB family radical SAM enzyme
MRVMLTHMGHKRLAEREANGGMDGMEHLLALIRERLVQETPLDSLAERALNAGWIEEAPRSIPDQEVALRYQRNPLQHVRRIHFEITTRCNFACKHCRDGGLLPAEEADISRLREAAEVFLSLGIRRYDFIGGEVSKYGDGWLELARYMVEADAHSGWAEPLTITLYTNGWWLGAEHIEAAGRTYEDEAAYLDDLRAHGVTHVLFSIDGPEARHDSWRGHPGLYQRVLKGFPRVIEAGIHPRLSVVMRPGDPYEFLRPFAEQLYRTDPETALARFLYDPMNYFNNFIDTGSGSKLRKGMRSMESMGRAETRCKAFFRPATLRIMANGALGICPLMRGQEGYGKIQERPLRDLLNRLDEASLYRLHASGGIGKYLNRLDRKQFAMGFDHRCSVITALNQVALEAQAEAMG